LSSFLQQLAYLDRAALDASEALRTAPLTACFVILSAWWVKGPLIIAAGGLADVRTQRRLPVAASSAALCLAVGSALAALLKELVDRARPALADPAFTALTATPASPSFPSGHAVTAFATAAAVGALHPRLRLPLFVLAALVGFSRIYLGVHYLFDVVAGAAIGTAIGLLGAWAIRRLPWLRSIPARS
jgi:membrane-associated phospholipid phosphatase